MAAGFTTRTPEAERGQETLASDAVSPIPRPVLTASPGALNKPPHGTGMSLSTEEVATLRAVTNRLIPQDDRGQRVDLVAAIDARLTAGRSTGWRYDALPRDADPLRRGLAGLDESAWERHARHFADLGPARQDAILGQVQAGNSPGEAWRTLPPARWFEEVLAECCEIYYADPVSQHEIGYAGYADRPAWQALDLNPRDSGIFLATDAIRDAREGTPGSEQRNDPDRSIGIPTPAHIERYITGPRLFDDMRRYDLDEPVDAVVIGTGPGGAPLLARLAQAGLRVVALEGGRLWDPFEALATDEREQENRFWSDERLIAANDPVALGCNNSGDGVGSGSLHDTAYVARPHPGDFSIHRDFGVGMDWPFGYDELAPYLTEVERTIGVSGPNPYPWGPEPDPSVLRPLPLDAAADLMRTGTATLGIRTAPAANAALSRVCEQVGISCQPAGTHRESCQAGRSNAAGSSMSVTFLPLAVRAGAELRTEAHATLFEIGQDGRIAGVVYRQGNEEYRQRTRAVFLCTGPIETPRLLLLNGIANSSGQVGRNLTAHVGMQVWGTFDGEIRPNSGIAGGLISEDTRRPANVDFAGGYLLQSIETMPVSYAGTVARGRGLWGEALKAHMRDFSHIDGITMYGECLPSATNFIELSDELDDRWLPKPRIHFTPGENERRMAAHGERLMRQICEAAGGRDLWSFPRYTDISGTCRMGNDARTSVVNADGRSHDIPNLFLSDNSTFPSSLSAHPSLTIMALSLRTADRFLSAATRKEV